MAKLFNPTLHYPNTLLTSAKSRWVPVVLLSPLLVYVMFLVFETELTNFIIPFFPEESDKSFGFYNDFLRLCLQEVLWWSFFLLLAWIILLYVPLGRVLERVERRFSTKTLSITRYVAGLSVLFAVLIAYYTLDEFANSADEYVYLYQAETMSQGKLAQEAHALPEFFLFNHIAQKDGMSVGRFPPGWPVLLSIPYVLNFPPYWVNAVLGGIAVLVFFLFARRYYSERVAIWSVICLVFSAYYVFNAASYFSHTSCLLFTIAFVYYCHRSTDSDTPAYPLLAGAFLGLLFVTRYFTAVLIFFPVIIFLIQRLRLKSIYVLFLIGVGSLPFVVLLLWYNYQITGDALLPVTVWADPTETIGFVKGHTFFRGIEYTIRRLLLFLYWCSPGILILYLVYLIKKVWTRTSRYDHPEDYFFIMLLAGYFFYHHLGGNQYGPRFLLEALPFTVVFVVNRVMQAKSQWPVALVAAGLIYAIVKFPFITHRESRVVDERMDLYVVVQDAGISNAVVLVSTHTGVIRPMPPTDLTRNDMDYKESVIYARDLPELNHQLLDFYRDRTFYRYVREPDNVHGSLVRIR